MHPTTPPTSTTEHIHEINSSELPDENTLSLSDAMRGDLSSMLQTNIEAPFEETSETRETLNGPITITGLENGACFGTTPEMFDLTVSSATIPNFLFIKADGSQPSSLEFQLTEPNGTIILDRASSGFDSNYTLSPGISYKMNIRGVTVDSDIIFMSPNLQILATNLSSSANSDCTLPVTRIGVPTIEQINKNTVSLGRSTASEVNCDYFEPQYSTDGVKRYSAHHIDGAGNSQTQRDYITDIDISHINQAATLYIKIKQIDFDGKEDFSTISSLQLEHSQEITFGPNPVSDLLNVFAPGEIESITIWNTIGEIVYQGAEPSINLGAYPQGLYLITITDNQGNEEKTTFTKH